MYQLKMHTTHKVILLHLEKIVLPGC